MNACEGVRIGRRRSRQASMAGTTILEFDIADKLDDRVSGAARQTDARILRLPTLQLLR